MKTKIISSQCECVNKQETYADALNDIFSTVSKRSKIIVVRSHDRYGDEIVVESKRYFIPVITRKAEQNANLL